jgi:2-polyprenyl-6-methoxyphenol hydroxylase-like FAD-dependent oxidoreductase
MSALPARLPFLVAYARRCLLRLVEGFVEVDVLEWFHYDLVVGADGIHSAIRKAILPEVEPDYRSFCACRTLMSCPQ